VQRHQIRHRVWKVICCAGVSDDHSHDRFANDNFGKLERKWITEHIKLQHLHDNLLFGKEIRALHTHSDNAAQHLRALVPWRHMLRYGM
jgi:hypothetical protein